LVNGRLLLQGFVSFAPEDSYCSSARLQSMLQLTINAHLRRVNREAEERKMKMAAEKRADDIKRARERAQNTRIKSVARKVRSRCISNQAQKMF
jgi:hypothetical protein